LTWEVILVRSRPHQRRRSCGLPWAELARWNDVYASAMRDVYAQFPSDLDVAALFAEAMMNRTPWRLWDLESGKPFDNADTLEMMAVLEKGMAQSAHPHPGMLHMYIHTMEMSPTPQRALRAADQLRPLRSFPAYAVAHLHAVRPLL